MSDWIGIRVRREGEYGIVTEDLNSFLRVLNVRMDNGEKSHITMNNFGEDPKETQEWEWYWDKTEDKKWYRF